MLTNPPDWLRWAQQIQALAQAGLTYSTNPFDLERYRALRQVAAEIAAAGSGAELPPVQALFEGEAGYQTPKLDARGVVFRGGKVLLVKELSDGGFTLPGGWVDVNEPPSHAVEREVWEESGYRVKARKLLAVYDRNLHGHPAYIFHIYKMFFLCELLGGEPAASVETAEAGFYGEDELPPLSIARTTRSELLRFFEHQRSPSLPTDFD